MNDLEKLQDQSPHAAAIGFVLTGTDGPACLFKMPYAEHLVGDPDTGVIHGGAITAILDNACGWAVRNHPDWDSESSMATLDLRIDYMEPAIPHLDVLVRSECFKLTHNIAFVKGVAYQKDVNDPIASSMATFMLGTPNAPREQEIRSGL